MKKSVMFGLLVSQMACDIDVDQRLLPAPYFEAAPVYNKLGSVIPSKVTSEAADDPFAAMDREVVQADSETSNLQLVSLGGVVRSTVPVSAMGRGWSVSSQGSDFMVVHHNEQNTDSSPDVMIYGYYDAQASVNKTLTSRRFISTIDPGLEQSGIWEMSPYIGTVLSALSLKNPMDVSSLSTLTNTFQPSLGLGIGYISNPNTFTGWKWVGRNQYEVYIRLAKTKGKFMPVEDALQSEISSLHFTGLDFERTAEQLMNIQDIHKQLYAQSGQTAEMTFGSLSYNQQTIYIAIMCVAQPTCAQSDALIDFLDNIRPIEQSDVFGSSIYGSPQELAQAFSIPIFGSSDASYQNMESTISKELQSLKNADVSAVLGQLSGVEDTLDAVMSTGSEMLEGVEGQMEGMMENTEGAPSQEPTPAPQGGGEEDSGY